MYKNLIGTKPLCIRFIKIDRFIRVFHVTRYLVLFGSGKYDFIYNRIRQLIGVKSGTVYVISHNYANIKVDSCNSSPLGKTLTIHNVMILTKSLFDKDKNNCYYNTFAEKFSYNFQCIIYNVIL